MIVIHQVPGAWGLPSVSPFCTKLQAYCRLAGLDHRVEPADVLRAPKGKVPYVRIDGEPAIGDSQLIIETLVARFGDRLDTKLDASTRATGHLVRRTLEEGTYFTVLWGRWVDDAGWAIAKPAYRAFVPALAVPFVRRSIREATRRQGIGRHTSEEIQAIACADWTAVSAVLGDHPFLLGNEPTSFDATLFSFVTSAIHFPHETKMRAHVLGLPNLVAYEARARARIFGSPG
jgi:glutathione S-transferase